MKKKRLVTLMGSICLVLVLVALLLPACAKEEAPVAPTPARPTPVAPAPVTTPAAPTGFEWPTVLKITTTGLGTTSYTQSCAIAPIMEKSTGMKVRTTPEDNDVARSEKLYAGKYDINVQGSSEVEMGYVGLASYAGLEKIHSRTRVLWFWNDLPFALVVLKDSPIKTIYDLKGKRIGYHTYSSTLMATVHGIVEGIGLTMEDVELAHASSYAEGVRSIVEWKADVTIASPISAVTYEIEGNPRGIRALDLPFEDKQLWNCILKNRPSAVPSRLSMGCKSCIGTMSYISPMLAFALDEADQELVYNLAKWFGENNDAYKDTHKMAPRMAVDIFRGFLDFCAFPIADGTVRYLKEIGKWTSEDDKWNNEAVKLTTKYAEAWRAATAEAKSKGIVIDYKNEEWLNLWGSYTEGFPRFVARL